MKDTTINLIARLAAAIIRELEKPEEPETPAKPVKPTLPSLAPYHTTDYQLVVWNGQRFSFGYKQRLVIKRLWEAWEKGRPEIDQRSLLAASDSCCLKLSDLFRDHPAWGTLIVRAASAVYRLAFQTPTEERQEREKQQRAQEMEAEAEPDVNEAA